MNKIQTIVADTINSAIHTKICPICNGKLYYNKVFSYQNKLMLIDTQYKCLLDHLLVSYIQCQALTMYNMSFPNGLSLVPINKNNLSISFAEMNGKELKLDTLEADNFKDLYVKLNKIVIFQ